MRAGNLDFSGIGMKDTDAVSHAVDACQHKLTARQTEFIAVIETCTSGRRPIPVSERRHSPRSLVPLRVYGPCLQPRHENDTIGQLQRGMRITPGDVMTPISTEALPYDSYKLVASACPLPSEITSDRRVRPKAALA